MLLSRTTIGFFPNLRDESRLDAVIALYMRYTGYTVREDSS